MIVTYYPATYITDTDFEYNLEIRNYIAQAQLLRLEIETEAVGLHINFKETEYMLYYQLDSQIITLEGNKLKQVEDFKCLGAWIQPSDKDTKIRIGETKQNVRNIIIESPKLSENKIFFAS